MTDPLVTYLNDHLSGATFAVSLLKDLIEQKEHPDLASISAELLAEIEADKAALSECVAKLDGGTNVLKEATAWVAQKFGKAKLAVETPLGQFEAIEMLMLGVTGKLALWDALLSLTLELPLSKTELEALRRRAVEQRRSLEAFRLKLAKDALQAVEMPERGLRET